MGSWIRRLFQELLLLILKLIDGVSQMFNILLGLSPVTYKNADGTATETSLVEWFLSQDIVVQVFLVLFVISIILLAVCCIAAVFRSMFHSGDGERKPATRVLGQGMRALMTTLVIAIVTVLAIGGANTLLVTVNNTFNNATGERTSISRVVLELGLTDGATTDWVTMEYVRYYQVNGELNDTADLETIQDSYETEEDLSKLLDPEIGKGNIYDVENDSWRWFITVQVSNGGVRSQEKLNNLFDENGYLRSDVDCDKIWGFYTVNWVGLPDGGWNSDNAAIEGATYNALIPYIAAFILLYILAITSFTLVKRLFDIISLFFVLPFVNATVPLDDGAHMKLWRETMISKVVMAYGAVFALGVFTIFAPLCNKVMILDNATLTAVLRLILICGAGLSIQGGIVLFSRLVGTGVAESNDMGQTARTLLAGGAGAALLAGRAIAGGAKSGKSSLFGTKTQTSQSVMTPEGIKTSVTTSVTGGLLNGAKNLMFGDRYVAGRASVGEKLKDKLAKSGGLVGMIKQGGGKNSHKQGGATAPAKE